MNDFERRVSDALKSAGSEYRPSDPYEAKQRFVARLRRRRLVLFAGSVAAATAVAAVAFVLVPRDLVSGPNEPLPPASLPQSIEEIPVGSAPTGVAFGNDQIFVANAGDGTVTSIDTNSNFAEQVFDVGGSPDDVAAGFGAAWVTDSERGIVTRVHPNRDAAPLEIPVGEPGTHMDIDAGTGAVWVASREGLHRIDPATNVVTKIAGTEEATDVAAGEGAVAVLTTTSLGRLEPGSPTLTALATVEPTDSQDLHVSPGAAWFANGDLGEVTRVDLESGAPSDPVYLGGTFIALAYSFDSVWAISGDSGDDGVLTRLDPETAEIIGERIRLEGRPFDVTTGAGSVWVVNRSANTVTRLTPEGLTP